MYVAPPTTRSSWGEKGGRQRGKSSVSFLVTAVAWRPTITSILRGSKIDAGNYAVQKVFQLLLLLYFSQRTVPPSPTNLLALLCGVVLSGPLLVACWIGQSIVLSTRNEHCKPHEKVAHQGRTIFPCVDPGVTYLWADTKPNAILVLQTWTDMKVIT